MTAEFLDAESDLHNLSGGNAGGTVRPSVVVDATGPC